MAPSVVGFGSIGLEPLPLMIRALHFRDNAVEVLPPDRIGAALEDDGCTLWVDIPEIDDAAVTLLRDVFHFHRLAIEDCTNGHVDTPKVDDYESYLFITAQSVDYAGEQDRLNLVELDLFLGKHYVVSLRNAVIPSTDELFATASRNEHIFTRGADFLAHTILDGMVDVIMPAVEDMDEALDDLEQRIIDRPERQLLTELLRRKRDTLRLRRAILPQRDMVNRLSRGEFGDLIDHEALIFYRDVYDHLVRVEELLDSLRDLADSALSSYLSAVNNRMNEIMKAMSVVAVIFLPLTLLASIFGTNLDYSPFFGLTLEGGFYYMIGVMVLTTVGLFAYFHYRGWL